MKIAIIVIVIIGIYVIVKMNDFKTRPVEINQSLSNIDVALAQRSAILTKQLAVCKGYAKHELETFKGVVEIRKGMSPKELMEAEAQMDAIQEKISVVSEAYPELRSNEVFQNLQASINITEENISATRRLYNNSVSEYNKAILTFPGSLIAKLVHAEPLDMFIASEKERADVSMDF